MASFGEILKRERELRGISLREISEATKISIRHLEALEESRIKDLPGGLFNKGFIRSYALHVGIDPEEMVNNYLYDVGQMEEVDPLESLRAMVPAEKRGPASRWRQWAILGAIFAGGGLLFAVLSFSFRSPAVEEPPASAARRPPPQEPGPAGAGPGTVPDRPGRPAREPEPPPQEAAGPEESNRPAPSGGEESPAAAAPAPALPPPPRRTGPPADLQFEMEMRHAARVRILCDGDEVLDKRLAAGERRSFTCRDLELSTSDSASFRYRLNRTGWRIPDESGRPLDGIHITPKDVPASPAGDAGGGTGGKVG